MSLRLAIAASGTPREGGKTVPKQSPEIPDGLVPAPPPVPSVEFWLEVLLDLARQRVSEARAIVVDKLKGAPDGLDKLALEVALACYDGPGSLRAEHDALEDWLLRDTVKSLRRAPTH
jgi:hypothetical protein